MDEFDPDRKNTLGYKEFRDMSIAKIKKQNPYHIQKSFLNTKGKEGFFSLDEKKQIEIVKLIRERADAKEKTPAKLYHTKNHTMKKRVDYITAQRKSKMKEGQEAEEEFRRRQQNRTLPTAPRHSISIRKTIKNTPTVQDMIANHKLPTFEELGGTAEDAHAYYTLIIQKEKGDAANIVFAAQQLEKANRSMKKKTSAVKSTIRFPSPPKGGRSVCRKKLKKKHRSIRVT